MAPSHSLGQQEPKISVTVHLTNGMLPWWLLNDGNDLHSFTSGLGVFGLQILSGCKAGLGQSVHEL